MILWLLEMLIAKQKHCVLISKIKPQYSSELICLIPESTTTMRCIPCRKLIILILILRGALASAVKLYGDGNAARLIFQSLSDYQLIVPAGGYLK